MQDIAFATLLFGIYFVSACCFLDNPNQSLISQDLITSSSGESEPKSELIRVEVSISTLPELGSGVDQPSPIAEAPKTEFEPEPEVEIDRSDIQVQKPTLEELLEGIDVDSLQLRPARKICGRLTPPIVQKVNGKDAPLSWLRSQIKSRLSEKPTEVVPVIQEILKAS
jgi:hypothetical protein